MEDENLLYSYFEKHLMEDKKPSLYFDEMLKCKKLDKYPFELLKDLDEIPQSPKYHPEGSVWKHTMLVVDNAAKAREKSKSPREFMWAALLHDIGKAKTTEVRKGRITSYDHDKHGAKLAIKFLEEFTDDNEFIKKVSILVRWHMQVLFISKDLPFADIEKMIKEVSIDEIALLSLCDRLGRGGMTREKIEEEKEKISRFVEVVENVIQSK